MKRKLIALLMAMMLIASGISAFAVDGNGKYEKNDIARMNECLSGCAGNGWLCHS